LAGMTVWYSGGNTNPGTTFTIAGNVAAGGVGTGPLPVTYNGSRASRADVCVGAYRPTIACGAFTFASDAYSNWSNLQFTGTAASVFTTTIECTILNCKVVNTSSTGTPYCFVPSFSTLIGCEASSQYGYGFRSTAAELFGCYAHDCVIGFQSITGGCTYINCVVDTCGGAAATSGDGFNLIGNDQLINCTIRNCKNGIYSAAAFDCVFINNIIVDCYNGANWGTNELQNTWAYNCFYGNTTPRTNVTAGTNDIATDPALTGVCGKGTNGASVATSLVFTSASNPFADVTTSDYLAIFAGTGTGIKLAVYAITSVANIPGQVTLATDPTDASNNISSCTFGVVKGSDFTVGATSSCIDAALDAQTYSGVTV
jgi:hypothetical protein